MVNPTKNTLRPTRVAEKTFTDEQGRALEILRIRYLAGRELFDPRRRVQLHFMRRLVRIECLVSSA